MQLTDTFKLAFSVLRTNKVRSFLTSLGIIIGIASVIVIMSVGAGAQSLIIGQLNSVGTNLIAVLPGASDPTGPPASVFGIVVTTLKYDDALAIKREVPNVVAATSYNTGIATMSYQNRSIDSNFYGVMDSYLDVEEAELLNGRFFTNDEDQSVSKVAVLGYSVWQDLFEGENPIGKKIKVKKEFFEVIGVMEERGTAAFQNQDDLILIPAMTAQKIMLGVRHVNLMRIKVNSSDNITRASEDVRLLLRDRHDIAGSEDDDFSVRNTVDAISILTDITNILKYFLAGIAAISLIVGGVGVMNIMLASVNERVREVGLRKAVGARRRNIVFQFVLETIAITLTGGIIGVIIGSLVSTAIALVARYLGYDWALVVTPSSIVMGFLMAIIVGFIFGLYPAKKAAKLNPIEALRYE